MEQENHKGKIQCPKCGNYFSANYEGKTIEKYGLCDRCFVKKQALIKVDNHYVPWGYQNSIGKGEIHKECLHEDIYALFPKVFWDEEYKKWQVTFESPDISYHKSKQFSWYFDTKEDIFEAMLGM